jgi:hypothetical protein
MPPALNLPELPQARSNALALLSSNTHRHCKACLKLPLLYPAQALTDPQQIQHCRAVAERGLSDLEAYTGASSRQNFDIHLKGACN